MFLQGVALTVLISGFISLLISGGFFYSFQSFERLVAAFVNQHNGFDALTLSETPSRGLMTQA